MDLGGIDVKASVGVGAPAWMPILAKTDTQEALHDFPNSRGLAGWVTDRTGTAIALSGALWCDEAALDAAASVTTGSPPDSLT
jgi:hypothetical protein